MIIPEGSSKVSDKKGENNYMKYIKYNLALAIIFLIACPTLYAQEKKAETMPPAGVVVSEVSAGIVAPEAEFIGTVYFKEI